MKHSIFDCKHTGCVIDIIHCEKGNELSYNGGDLELRLAQEGKPLYLECCKDCPEFESMGGVVKDEDKGWTAA